MRNLLRFLCLTMALLMPVLMMGQAISGDLVGTVTDNSGAAVTGATVVAVNTATNVKSTTTTNATGEYRFTNLLIGTYDITASAKGFSNTTLTGVTVALNKTVSANFNMQVGGVSTTVEVNGSAAPLIDTTTAQIQSTYDSAQLQDLPAASVGLGVLNLSMLQAGVASAGSMGAGTGPSVGGQRPRNNNFTIEGVDNNDKGVTGPLVYVPNDAVAEFSVLENQFSPEFGHSSGGQFNTVVRGGSNDFHGRAYEYMQNRNLNAVDQILVNQGITSNPRYDNNRFGGQVGGPVIKNKLFFFANFEYNPIGQSATSSPLLAPTATGYTTLAGITGLNQNNLSGLKQYAIAPAVCTADQVASGVCPGTTVNVMNPTTKANVPVEIGVIPIVAPNYQNGEFLTTSMDYNLSEKDQIRGRYIYNKFTTIDAGAALPTFFTSLIVPYHLVTLAEYHQFSSSVTNEFRVGYNRTANNYTVPSAKFPGQDAFPNVTLDDLGLNVGPDPNAPQYAVENTYSIVDNISWIKGNHSLKFGAEARKYIDPQLFVQRSRGDYEWNTMSDFLNDTLPVFGERSFGAVGYSGDEKAIYWYVNDTWKVKPNLSLNLGLRYEYTGVPYGWTQMSLNSLASVPGVLTIGSPEAPKHDFMPRLGFAWSPKGKDTWSVRGGFGMAYDVLYDNIGTLSRPPQIGFTIDCNATTTADCASPTGAFMANGGIPPQASSGITTYDAATARSLTSSYLPINVKYPYSESWNLGVQHTFGKDYTLEVRYVGTRGVHLNVQDQIDRRALVSSSNYLPTFLQAPTQAQLDALPATLAQLKAPGSLVPAFSGAGFTSTITGYEPWGASTYHGLQTQLNRRISNGLEFQAAWTWSHAIDNSTADFHSTDLTPRRAQDGLNLDQDRANSALDHAHRLSVSAVYEVPFFKGANSYLLKNIVGNWQFTPTYIYETGEWADVQSGADANLNGDSAGDRAIYNASGVPGTGSGITNLCNSGLAAAITAGTVPATATCGASGTWAAGTPLAGKSWSTSGYQVGYLAKNGNAQYIVAGPGALSTAGRNTLQMPPINNWDLGVKKHLDLTERFKFEFGAQLINAFNHPQFIAGFVDSASAQNSSVNPATINGTDRNYLIPSNSKFNNARAVFSSNPRNMQLYAKFTF